jgi:hypothetical protein
LARALMTLARAERTGVLCVHAGRRGARIAVVDGVPRAVRLEEGDADALGDLLLRAGDLDAGLHAEALDGAAPRGPVGAWLVDRGLASRPAVELALRRQLRMRLLAVFRWTGLDYRFEAGTGQVGVPWVSEPMSAADLVLGALRHLVAALPARVRARLLRESRYELTPLGECLLGEAALWPEEAALGALLRQPSERAALIRHITRSERAAVALCALLLVGGVREEAARYGLLLRKRGQVRRAESPRALLDLPEHASAEEGRRALKRLARQLHPDRVGEDAAGTSNDVLRALLDAERELRTSG